ncbi:glycosyltransferase family 4 protein [Prosthecomicrobium pneumaticum]|uniref:Glycosyltransferase involved in cell wall biosynthesis n=1 Tax=Prosthecomicrobium pneumaticum TaxID=81895 RepID=A0A7W9FJM6_9HYPH|nr:glycosyltransferase family 4 protein [Prosthecomicrobium pneumaticum]MBB5751872.1 glycosyltransferase involved in cell wall biosynthesis [Prosthecomicrobium pneumaticum]
MFGQQAALAFAERDALEAYLTSFAFDPSGTFARLLKMLPDRLGGRLLRELARRSVTAVPRDRVETAAFWEVLRTLADKGRLDRRTVDRIWDLQSRRFAAAAGRRLRRGGTAVYAYEYTALEAFEAADRLGLAKILDFPSLNSRAYQELQRVQKAIHPELASPLDGYFETLFETRQSRRDAEMRSADVVITNSSVTRASHIAGGADPARTFAVPYGAPPVVEGRARTGADGPLRVIWAGTFSIRKAAHLFIDAWRRLDAGRAIEADVFGAQALPENLWRPAPEGMTFHGSVPQTRLFAAYDAADVLMFPTLSDGFGMVVTEAFSRGVPVITTDQAGASDLVRHEVNGLIIPAGDAAAIAAALQWCLDNRRRLAAMRREALETARNWQWRDYRAALYGAIQAGLGRRDDRGLIEI